MSLMRDAQNELNGRQRGRVARLARLDAAQIPTNHDDLRRWLRDRQDEADPNAVYHACTTRIQNGVDLDLPTARAWGCRVTRVSIQAAYLPAGEAVDSDTGETLVEPAVVVRGGKVGVGYVGHRWFAMNELGQLPGYVDPLEAQAIAEAITRTSLLRRRDVRETREEAEREALRQLRQRAWPDTPVVPGHAQS